MEMPAEFTTGEWIRHLCERRGMTRVVLANLVGYSADWLKRIEAGQRGVSIPALVWLARLLRVEDLSVLIDGEIEMPVSAWDGPHHPAGEAARKIAGLGRSARPMMPVLLTWRRSGRVSPRRGGIEIGRAHV